ncbi:hypothetical protein Amsp01_105170 [Amycolatopsis sp. NBRC 101858]|uniref:ABC transporter permease n=1 Tax=Amycolatopsis sp. NBRC 101858 TaxID=3032200 RepID=UPI0024A59012|nr:ABC transporter permease [Amycolatopsis sp. NBRC 101858]GLY44494.1 hypothetical protein Amsp01_105170 [Amycolatopsis sp. NBRC 101858]
MNAAVWAEVLKARRSRLPWTTGLAFTIAAGFGGLVMFILQDVRRARALGLLGTKAALTGGTADWPGYFALLAQTIAVAGTLLFGLVVVWVFGREFSQNTAKDLLALPTPRAAIVAAATPRSPSTRCACPPASAAPTGAGTCSCSPMTLWTPTPNAPRDDQIRHRHNLRAARRDP